MTDLSENLYTSQGSDTVRIVSINNDCRIVFGDELTEDKPWLTDTDPIWQSVTSYSLAVCNFDIKLQIIEEKGKVIHPADNTFHIVQDP